METAYQKVKVHNELEWCQVTDLSTKELLFLTSEINYIVMEHPT